MDRFVSIINKYKSLLLMLFLLIGGLSLNAQQNYNYQIVLRASATGTKSANITATGAAFHQITWNKTGTVSACSLRVDSSADGVTWNSGDIISAQVCTSNGQTISTSHIVNFVRINVTSFTGTGQVAAVLDGFSNLPSGGGNLSGTLTATHIPVASGANALSDSNLIETGGILSSTDKLNWDTIPCASLSSSSVFDLSCATSYNNIITNSVAASSGSLNRNTTIYYETDQHQANNVGALAVNSTTLVDAGTNTTFVNRVITSNPIVSGSAVTLAEIDAYIAIPRLINNAHVQKLVLYHSSSANTIAAGSTADLVVGVDMGLGVVGTATNTVAFENNVSQWQYGALLGGTLKSLLLDDTANGVDTSGACHGVANGLPATPHDCWFGGSNTPESQVTGNIGSIFARQNGSLGTSLYVKESGTGSTGWSTLLSSHQITLTGLMSLLQVGDDVRSAQTSTVGPITLFTVGSATASFLLNVDVNCKTAVSTATVTLTANYTDASNTAQTIGPTVAACTTLGSSSIATINMPIRAKNATTITYTATAANSPNFDVSAQLYQRSTN